MRRAGSVPAFRRGRISPEHGASSKRIMFPGEAGRRYHARMSDSFLDRLGSVEKQRVIKRLRSPEAYERLREKVKGPEDLERALDRAEKMAELHFALEANEPQQEKMKQAVSRAFEAGGIDAVAEKPGELSEEARAAIAEGKFSLAVSTDANTHDDILAILPEGNVGESVPVSMSLTESCVSQLSGNA